MRDAKKEYLLVAALFAVISLTSIALFLRMPSLEYILAILSVPVVVYTLLRFGERP